jgi:aminoglycoside 3-N-acetyltransferase
LDSSILLLGVGHDCNTSLHLAESRSGTMSTRQQGSPILVDGVRQWVTYRSLDVSTDEFEQVGAAAAEADQETVGLVGGATSRLLKQRSLVDFAVHWFAQSRSSRTMDS